MVPTVIVLGFFGGLIPRYRWWTVPIGAITWSIMLTMAGDPSMSLAQIWSAGLVVGGVNAAAGVAAGWGFSTVLPAAYRWFRRSPVVE